MNDDLQEVKSAGRVIEILELLARSSGPMSLKVIVDELRYPKSSAFGLLATLVARGYVQREQGELYRLHDAVRGGFNWVGGPEANLIATAQPVMEALRDTLGETVFLGVRRRDGRVKLLGKCVSRQAIRFDSDLIASDASYCTAMGRVLLAHWQPDKVHSYMARERIVRLTEHTVIDRAKIRKAIEAARVNGYAISDQEAVAGGSGVAAPVRDQRGEVVAALNAATLSMRFDQQWQMMIEAVIRHADELSSRLGYRPATPQER